MDSGLGVADVLPEIVTVVRETDNGAKIVIKAEGGIRTGFDGCKNAAPCAHASCKG